ncbi:hypothetical protein B484DRAFT_449707 [Ochromonadaceae sp. CCMP2298]|nr:hypothetical protein B484DRAFT_449707 [Ochromonadaceae sp. CCMP2298]|mmetsp:Transcript_14233/g.31418  ORF Transcript_14233/g.31418 Transcript_14233/m.31418 type:complete len:260 (+) Transcript_14233:133-912(+)
MRAPVGSFGCWVLLFGTLLQGVGGYSATATPRASRGPVQNIRSVDDLVEGLQTLGSGSMLLWKAAQPGDGGIGDWRGAAEGLVVGRETNFDLDFTLSCDEDCDGGCEKVRSAADLIPAESRSEQLCALLADMDRLTQVMRSAAQPGERVKCRLALMDGVRCPKWHEDYVNLRLIKSYHGAGSDWAPPDDWAVRAANAARAALDRDPTVSADKIRHAECGDCIVIAGRRRADRGSVPVLHRSPVTSSQQKRLLFTVTLTG